MACNTMFGAGNNGLILPPDNNRQFALKKCEIGLFEREIWDLYCDYRVLVDSARHLAADSLRGQQALYFGNLICNTFDKNDRLSWAKCREIANNYLKQTNGTAQHKVTAIGHCHIDTGNLRAFSSRVEPFWPISFSVAVAVCWNKEKMCEKLGNSIGIHEALRKIHILRI